MPVVRTTLRFIAYLTLIALCGIGLAILLGPSLSQGVIAFAGVTPYDTSSADIYVVDVAKGITANLTRSPIDEREIVWSPDGTQLAFSSTRDGNEDIFLFNIATGDIRQLTRSSGDDMSPAWSPDGRRLVYVSRRDNLEGLYLIDLEDGTPHYLAPGYWGSYPAWRPDPSAAGGDSP